MTYPNKEISARVANKATGETVREVALDGSVLIINGIVLKVGKTPPVRADNKKFEKGTGGINLYIASDPNNLDLSKAVLLE